MQTAQFIIELLKAVFLGIVEGITEYNDFIYRSPDFGE